MSRENVELVLRAFDAFNEGDAAFFLSLYDPAIVLTVGAPALESGVYYGAEAVERFYRQFFATFGGTYRFDAEEVVEVGDSARDRQSHGTRPAKRRGRGTKSDSVHRDDPRRATHPHRSTR